MPNDEPVRVHLFTKGVNNVVAQSVVKVIIYNGSIYDLTISCAAKSTLACIVVYTDLT